MSKPKVVITRRWPEAAEARAKKLFDVVLNEDDHPMSVAELQEALETADAVCPTVSDQITAEVLGAEPMKCKILGNYGVGFNHIDLDTAKSRNLVVTNTPEVLTDCTADIAMILMLSVARRTGEGERHVRGDEADGDAAGNHRDGQPDHHALQPRHPKMAAAPGLRHRRPLQYAQELIGHIHALLAKPRNEATG